MVIYYRSSTQPSREPTRDKQATPRRFWDIPLSEDIPLGLPLGLAKIPSQARSQPSDKWGRFSQILDLFQGLKIGVPSGGPSSLYQM